MPKLFVVPWQIAIVPIFAGGFAFGFALHANGRAVTASRNLVACENRAQSALVKGERCDSLLTTCMASVRVIADELALERVEF